jgi:uroporphyrinogen III methyltransferase/synthase
MTIAARDALVAADVVLHDALLSEESLAFCPPGCRVIDVGKRAGRHSATQDEINAMLVEHAAAGHRVVRLKGGDPFTFGRGGEEALACRAAGIPFTVIPGVSSAIAGPAYAGIPITHRGLASMVTFVTAQEATSGPPVDWDWAARSHTLVVLMGANRIVEVAGRLVDGGADPATPAACIEAATTPGQRSVSGTLDTIAKLAEAARIAPPALIVVGDVAALPERLAWFEPKPLAGKRVAVTRPAGAADPLAAALRARGARVVDAPVVAIEPRTAALTTDERIASRWDWIVFTSANAVDVFFSALAAAGKDARALGGTLAAAIGPATSAALIAHGVRPDFEPSEAYGAVLGEELPRVSGARVLLPLSTLARPDLEDALRKRGAHVERVDIYATVPAPLSAETLDAVACADAVTFASPSAVRALAAQLEGRELRGRLVSIGAVTSEAVRTVFGRVDAEARDRGSDGIAGAVEEVLAWGS